MKHNQHIATSARMTTADAVAMPAGPLRGEGTGARICAAPVASARRSPDLPVRLRSRRPRSVHLAAASLLCLLATMAVTVSPASAASGWWHLTSGARPTALQPGVGKPEVQQLTVDATEGLILLQNPENPGEGRIMPLIISPAALETTLDELYGAETAEVTGGPVATGTGDVLGPVATTGTLTSGSPTVEEVPFAEASELVPGQTIEGAGIPAGTTVLSVEGQTVTLSAEATASASGVELTAVPSTVVANVTSATGAFSVGQELSARGIAPGTTIEAVGAGTITLSKAPVAAGGAAVKLGVLAASSGAIVPYTVTFKGARTGRPLPLITALPIGLSGGTAEAKFTEVSKGASDGEVVVSAANLGEVAIDGSSSPVQVVDHLPAGVEAVSIEANVWESEAKASCVLATVTCTFEGTISPFELIEMRIGVKVTPGTPSGPLDEAVVSGGEVPEASLKRSLKIGGSVPFGVDEYEVAFENPGGSLDTQAGSHPFQMTTTVGLTVDSAGNPVSLPKEVDTAFPAGFIGNPTPFAQCTLQQFLRTIAVGKHLGGGTDECPAATALGVAQVTVNEPQALGIRTLMAPVFNIEPAVGEPARFGFMLPGVPVLIDTSVRTGTDYGITAHVRNISEVAGLLRSEITLWGVPGLPAHHNSRGFGCLEETRGYAGHLPCNALEGSAPQAFLAMPTSCEGPLQSTIEAASWDAPKAFTKDSANPMQALDGCNRLPFNSELKVTPDGRAASTPTGLTTDVHVPQEEALNAGGLAPAELRDITVALPQGLELNASAADGLDSCSLAQIGYTGMRELNSEQEPGVTTPQFTAAEPSCPNASKVATVTIRTPVLPNALKGFVYLAAPQNFSAPPQENPFESLVAMYIVARDPVSGVLLKLPFSVSLDQATGQVTATVKETPQAPFEDAEFSFFGGDRAPLATPARCGSYESAASFTPWSGAAPIGANAPPFTISSGPNGSPCPGAALPFSPSLAAGSPNINAGSFSPLTTTITRQDGEQDIQQVTLHMAPGMSGILAGVPLCPEAQANAGTCGEASRIGETIVSVGLGGDPFTVTGGKVYLTEKYQGAPFGLSIVNPADAGPFHLGKVVVRARIEVDPATAQLTITTGEIPHIIKGFPLQIKHVNVNINRPGFTFNPTNCNPMSITGSIGSTEGASSPVSTQFQVTNCAALRFAPKFTVSTTGKTSKANGASLTAKLSYPNAPQGSQANITKVKVELPKQLPSRLTTLQKACTSAQFQANPAGCPAASIIGHAVVHTPLLPVPLTGPAYFVSHGGEAFPSLIIVLQGYGVTVQLVGTTFISKAGVTSSTFKTVPDVPFNTFELTLSQGKFSALASNLPASAKGSFCGQKLVMPAEFLAQNGALVRQNTPVAVTGCAKHKLTRAQKLAAALRACRHKPTSRRAACARKAHRKYGGVKRKR